MLLEYKVAPHYGDMCELNPDCHINGEPLDYNDFVRKYDHDKAHAQEFGCRDMRCDIKQPSGDVLNKYCITVEEYQTIAFEISEALKFGACDACV